MNIPVYYFIWETPLYLLAKKSDDKLKILINNIAGLNSRQSFIPPNFELYHKIEQTSHS